MLTFLKLCQDEWISRIAISVKVGQGVQTLLPSVFRGKPTRALGEEEESAEEDKSWYPLQPPRYPERCRAVYIRAAVRDEIHDKDAPLDGPLLDADDSAADLARCEFGQVDADLRGSETDC